MHPSSEHFVPKVHPASRPAEADDPLTLHATPVAGDPEVMLECLVQEYAWMGWDTEQVFTLFRDPNYPALNALLCHYGEDGVHRRVAGVLERMGSFHVSGAVRDDPEPDDEGPDLIELGTSRMSVSKGDSHAQGE